VVEGVLGDVSSGVMFLAENPSLRGIKKANKDRSLQDPENQWSVSPGDHIFRKALFESAFKDGSPTSYGGWHCYVTNIIKLVDTASAWKARTSDDHFEVAKAFAPVLQKELELMEPDMIVVMGKRPKELFMRLQGEGVVLVPSSVRKEYVRHYAYFNYGPPDPDEVSEYEEKFQWIQESLRAKTIARLP
jgi:hypothetical protein